MAETNQNNETNEMVEAELVTYYFPEENEEKKVTVKDVGKFAVGAAGGVLLWELGKKAFNWFKRKIDEKKAMREAAPVEVVEEPKQN